jgi:alpha-galactosidase
MSCSRRAPSAASLRLIDIDAERLAMMHKVIAKLIADTGREKGWTVRSSTNRKELLGGTTYAICSVEVSGTACVAYDNDIPLKYGIDQCIGDTLGPGGLFKGLRTVPAFLDILRDMRELCPGAIMLNYTNPMSMLVLAAGRAVPEVPVVGLCHSVQGTSHLLATYANVPYEEMEWECAGINHLAWFTTLRHKGRDLYSTVLYEKIQARDRGRHRRGRGGTGIPRQLQRLALPRRERREEVQARGPRAQGHVRPFWGVHHRKLRASLGVSPVLPQERGGTEAAATRVPWRLALLRNELA